MYKIIPSNTLTMALRGAFLRFDSAQHLSTHTINIFQQVESAMRPSLSVFHGFIDCCIKQPGPSGWCVAEHIFKAIETGISVGVNSLSC